MDNRQRTWLWLAVAVSLAEGSIIVLNDSGAGWFLIITGTIHFGVLTRPGHGLVASTPGVV
jgi:hypothetical protein